MPYGRYIDDDDCRRDENQTCVEIWEYKYEMERSHFFPSSIYLSTPSLIHAYLYIRSTHPALLLHHQQQSHHANHPLILKSHEPFTTHTSCRIPHAAHKMTRRNARERETPEVCERGGCGGGRKSSHLRYICAYLPPYFSSLHVSHSLLSYTANNEMNTC